MNHPTSVINRLYWSLYLATQLRGQRNYPYRPRAAIEQDRDRRARAIIAYAYRYVPYYRDTLKRLQLRPADFHGAADLQRLPIIERQQIQRDPEYFLSTAQPRERYLHLRTGGSSGAPCAVYHDLRGLLLNRLQQERMRAIVTRLLGRSQGYSQVSVVSAFSTGQEIQHFMRVRMLTPRPFNLPRHFLSLFDAPEINRQAINDRRPAVIHSYGSYLETLYAYLQSSGQPMHRPGVITYTSDGLSDTARRRIMQEFGIPVLSTYSAVEALGIGFECEQHRGLHLNIDMYPVRIVDPAGQPQPIGVSGDVVISNLVNRGTVLLNYRLGDLATCLPDACPCGRSLPLLSFPEGRTDDWILLPNGRQLHPQALRVLFTDEQSVWQYQVVQHGPDQFAVALIAAEDCDQAQLQERLIGEFRRTLGADSVVTISFVADLPRTARGKVRPIVTLRQSTPSVEQHAA
jgi:phenylacetate-CoA ligase